ncbi:pilus assembly protein CpaE [Paraburkholderia sp. RAU2J]|uniref:AAA family ATPase n=1 Tax=Paraburkholderia sp. RAU2J TaxID=1938810 RepID=UPI000EB5AEA0|nr:AAA family ATPase [Paraburkholderia sp. RAU2J]RKT25689.1 pilus assembly protein CpaE [Paraburkholderia sp. RAU2J]
MSTTEFNSTKNNTGTRVADFIAFVNDRKTEQVLKSFVLDQVMPHTHVAVGGVDDAIAYLAKIERSPQFLLIDLQNSVMPLSDLGRLAEVCEPSVQVVALGERNDVGLFRSLLKIGVRDYLVKPLTVELLKRTVNVAEGKVSPVMLARAGKTIAFAGTRGGVGTTTVALNIARHLAEDTHRRVAYVDLNLYGGAANSMLGIQSNNGLSDVLQNVHRLDPQYVERTLIAKGARLFVLSAELDYGNLSPFQGGALARVLELLCDSFHYVILDVGSLTDPLAGDAFDYASRVYLVADPSVHSTRETIRILRFIEDRDNNPPTSLLLNNPNAASTGKVQAADFTAAVGRAALYEIPFEAKAVTVAENLGEAPNEKAPNGFNQTIMRIARDLTGQPAAAERTFFQKLRFRRR